MTQITNEQFQERLDKLCETNPLANRLINGDDNMMVFGFMGLANHLQLDALKRMGLRREVDEVSGSISFHELEVSDA